MRRGYQKMSDAVIEHGNETGIRTALGTLLIEGGYLDNERLEEALRIGADTGERLGEVVVRMGWASEDDLAKTLADQWHLRYVERSAISFDGDALSRMSREEATRLEALPMQISEDGAVVVALAEPTDARLLALRSLLGDRIDCVVVAKTAIDAGLRSELLPKNGNHAPAADKSASDSDEQHEENENDQNEEHEHVLSLVTPDIVDEAVESVDETDEPTSSDFDEVARSLSDGLSAQLGSLRAIVVEAESTRARDAAEITRLTAELSARTADLVDQQSALTERAAELVDRNETIKSMQQKLRELADTLEHSS
jgi:Type II secretion system (T2SS), protein E, N-terminal domain